MADGQLSAAALRREKRRQNILARSEDRLKKITGQPTNHETSREDISLIGNDVSSEDIYHPDNTVKLHSVSSQHAHSATSESVHQELVIGNHTSENIFGAVLSQFDARDVTEQKEPVHLHQEEEPVHAQSLAWNSKEDNELATSLKPNVSPFRKARTLLVLIAGLMVRFSFQYSFGLNYVQSIFNPFVALEIAILGYQRAVDMDLGENVKGGLWLSMLVLAGFKMEIIDTYKSAMGVVTAAVADFTLFFFGFMVLHLVL